jgi:hypothetical protein
VKIWWQQIHHYSGLFPGVASVGICPDFTLLDECQNAGKMEKPDAFYPSGFTNGDGSDKIYSRPFVEFAREQPE